jgi:hypothetical protein
MGNYHRGWFQPLSGRIISKEFIGFDCETYSDKNIFRFATFYFDANHKFTFSSKKEMINFLYNNKRSFQGKYIVATNLQFDLVALFFDTPEWNDLNIVWSKNKIIMASIKFPDSNKHGKIEFIDTLNFNLASVKELGEIINISKIKIDKKLFKKKVLNRNEFKLMVDYNINDCLISQQYMYHLQNTLNGLGGNLKITMPSSSLDLFRRKFMHTVFIKERVVLNDNTIEEFILKGYYGGRCEAFAIGEFTNVNYYDANSLHPYSMLINDYPLPQSIKIGSCSINEIINYMGISECIVECPENMLIPILPFRKNDNKIIYPVGIFKGVWTHALLSYAIDNGYKILEVIKQYIYKDELPIFHDYINTLYNLRKKYKAEKNPEEVTIKLCMNSLYGKFAQKPSDIYEVIDANISDLEMNRRLRSKYEMELTANGKFFICTKKSNRYPKNSFPILSSYVTSHSQIFLHKNMKNERPLYTDTDSIMTQNKLSNDLIGLEIGQFKLEKFGEVEIVSPKCYAFNKVPTVKGLSINKDIAGNDLTNIEKYFIFKNYINGDKILQTNFMKLKSALRSAKGYKPNEIVSKFKSRKIFISDKREYTENYSIPILVKINEAKSVISI